MSTEGESTRPAAGLPASYITAPVSESVPDRFPYCLFSVDAPASQDEATYKVKFTLVSDVGVAQPPCARSLRATLMPESRRTLYEDHLRSVPVMPTQKRQVSAWWVRLYGGVSSALDLRDDPPTLSPLNGENTGANSVVGSITYYKDKDRVPGQCPTSQIGIFVHSLVQAVPNF